MHMLYVQYMQEAVLARALVCVLFSRACGKRGEEQAVELRMMTGLIFEQDGQLASAALNHPTNQVYAAFCSVVLLWLLLPTS